MGNWLEQVLGRGSDAGSQPASRLPDAIDDWMLRVDPEGRLLAFNHPRESPFPMVSDDALGREVSELFPAKAGSVISDLVARSAESGRTNTFEYAFDDGQRSHYAEMRVFPEETGTLLLVARDLTGRKTTEARLRMGKERYALAVQGANDGLWDWALRDNRVYWSLQWKLMLGLEADGVSSSPDEWFSRIHPDDVDAVRKELHRHLRGNISRFESEHRIWHATGEWLWVLARGMAMRNSKGRAYRIAGSLTDLTHRRVVAAAAEKGLLLEHATRAVGIGIAIWCTDGSLTAISPTLHQMVGAWGSAEAWWAAIQDRFELPTGMLCPVCGNRHQVGSTHAEIVDPTEQLRVFEITSTGHAHEVHADPDAHVLLVEDVTEPTLAERQLHSLNQELVVARDRALASSRAKSTFLANMSHELRTPLNAIIGYSEMLLEDVDAGDSDLGSEELIRIREAGSQLRDLIAGILDLSRSEAGMLQIDLADLDMERLVSEVASAHLAALAARDNAFEWVVEDGVGAVRTDPSMVRQVLTNLLSNANKFTESGRVEIVVAPDGDDEVRIDVRDTGIGMDASIRDRLFDEFYQGDLSSTKRYGGAGLGLAVTRRFVDALGGRIAVESELGGGSTFSVWLPRAPHE